MNRDGVYVPASGGVFSVCKTMGLGVRNHPGVGSVSEVLTCLSQCESMYGMPPRRQCYGLRESHTEEEPGGDFEPRFFLSSWNVYCKVTV